MEGGQRCEDGRGNHGQWCEDWKRPVESEAVEGDYNWWYEEGRRLAFGYRGGEIAEGISTSFVKTEGRIMVVEQGHVSGPMARRVERPMV